MIVWTQSELLDIMKDTVPDENVSDSYHIDMAKNEGESFQIGIYADNGDLSNVIVEAVNVPDEIKCEVNVLDFIFYSQSSVRAGNKILRALGPAEIPEIVAKRNNVDIPDGSSRSALITFTSDKDTKAGDYTAEFTVIHGDERKTVKVNIKVYDVVIPNPEDSKYGYICWANDKTVNDCNYIFGIDAYSEEFWQLNIRYAKQLYKERQTWFNVNYFDYIRLYDDENGNPVYDYTVFDKFIGIYLEYMKPQYIAGMHILYRNWETKNCDFNSLNALILAKDCNGNYIKAYRDASSDEAKSFTRDFLSKLAEHLKEKGWLKLWAQHVADEINTNIQYEQATYYYDMVHECMPGVRTIDAVRNESATYFERKLDIHVPCNWFYNRSPEEYDVLNNGDTEVWFYTCLQPQYNYMGRIGDYHLMGNRLLHWYSFKHNLKGYLHYAWNSWSIAGKRNHPEEEASCFGGFPCDAWIVYPDRENKDVLWSIRAVGNRDSLEDLELLYLAEAKDKRAARFIAETLVGSPEDFTLNPEVLKAARRNLLQIAENKL